MLEKLHWLGHASFRFDGSKTLYFDPWKLPKGPKKADIIFVSHEHYDHFSKDDIASVSTKDTIIVSDKTAGGQLQGNIICKAVKVLMPGENLEIGNATIKAVASYNLNKEFHTKESKKLGYLVNLDGITVYHAGDTDKIPEMKGYACDIALLPVSGTYVMNAQEAVEAALAVNPRVAVPMHYGDIVGLISDAAQFKELLEGKIEVKILKAEK